MFINGVNVSDANFNDTTPAAPAGDLNVLWQTSGGRPADISAYVDVSALAPLLDHGLLLGLADDDHLNNAYLLGRVGGQDYRGGTSTTEDLTLGAYTGAFAWASTGRIVLKERLLFDEDFTYNPNDVRYMMRFSGTWTSTSGVGVPPILRADRTIRFPVRSFLAQPYTNWDNTQYQPTTASTDFASNYVSFFANPRFIPDFASGTATADRMFGFWCDIKVGVANAGNAVVPFIEAFRAFNTNQLTDASSTVTNLYGLSIYNPNATGTITNQVGIQIEDLNRGATLTLSLRSLGLATEMHHAGPALFGSTNAPDVTMDVDGDLATRRTNRALSNGANDNISASNTSFLYITGPSSAFTVGGFTDGQNGKRLVVYNSTAQNMTIENEETSSTAANRILTPIGTDMVTSGVGAIELIYNSAASRWLLINYEN